MNKLVRFGTCTKDCYGSCVFHGIWNDDALEYKLLKAKPIQDHPFTDGFFCSKYKNRQDLLYHPNRLKKPLIRTGSKPGNYFETISSQNALTIIANKVIKLLENKEQKSIIGAYYAGNSGLISMNSPLRFFNKIGATITKAGLCNEGGCEGLKKLFGTYSITNPFQINNPETHLIVIWGSNLSETNSHAYKMVKRALKNTTKLVVIDSRNTQISKKSDCFLQIYPGTEQILVKLIVNEIIKQKICDLDFLKKYVDSYKSIFSDFEQVKKSELMDKIGLDLARFHHLIDLLVENQHHTLFMIGYGVQKDFYGGRILQAIALVQILLGNIAKPGTGIIYSQSDFVKPLTKPLLDYITQSPMFPRLNQIPLINLGKALSTKEFKLLIIYNFNPLSSLPNQNLLREAFLNKNLFIVVLEMFLNETTNYADMVIPAKFDLEISDIITPYYIPSISINIGGPCPYLDCLSNHEFFQQLAWKIGYNQSAIFTESDEEIFKKGLEIFPPSIQKDLKSKGYYLLFNKSQIPFETLSFPTQNHKIQVQDIKLGFGDHKIHQRLERKINEFILISPSHEYFLHSQLGQLNSKYCGDFEKIFLNPEDITKLSLKIDDEVVVKNEYGSAHYLVDELTSLKSGIALIYSGGSSHHNKGTNVNLFTSDIAEESGLSGSYYSTVIQVNKLLE
jgi:anaerobic selenocysteine-containing dehydrogenase